MSVRERYRSQRDFGSPKRSPHRLRKSESPDHRSSSAEPKRNRNQQRSVERRRGRSVSRSSSSNSSGSSYRSRSTYSISSDFNSSVSSHSELYCKPKIQSIINRPPEYDSKLHAQSHLTKKKKERESLNQDRTDDSIHRSNVSSHNERRSRSQNVNRGMKERPHLSRSPSRSKQKSDSRRVHRSRSRSLDHNRSRRDRDISYDDKRRVSESQERYPRLHRSRSDDRNDDQDRYRERDRQNREDRRRYDQSDFGRDRRDRSRSSLVSHREDERRSGNGQSRMSIDEFNSLFYSKNRNDPAIRSRPADDDAYWAERRAKREKIGENGVASAWIENFDQPPRKHRKSKKSKKKKKKRKMDATLSSDDSSESETDEEKWKNLKKQKKRKKRNRSEEDDVESEPGSQDGKSRKRLRKEKKKAKKSKRDKKKKKKRRESGVGNGSGDSDAEHEQLQQQLALFNEIDTAQLNDDERKFIQEMSDKVKLRQKSIDGTGDLNGCAVGALNTRDLGGALLPGEGAAMAAYVQDGKRIPRRGEIGLTSNEIEAFEQVGYVMSGSRHRRMEAVRLRKENQIYSADEKRALAMFNKEERQKREEKILSQLHEMVLAKQEQAKSKNM